MIVLSLTKKEMLEAERIGCMRQESHPSYHRDSIRLKSNMNAEHGDGGIDFIFNEKKVNIKTRSQEWHDMLVRADHIDRADIYVLAWFNSPYLQVTFWGWDTAEKIKLIPPTPAKNKLLKYWNHVVIKSSLRHMNDLVGQCFSGNIP